MIAIALVTLLAVAESPVEPFNYNLAMEAMPRKGFSSNYARRDTFYLRFDGNADRMIPWGEPGHRVHATVTKSNDGIDIVARSQFDVTPGGSGLFAGESPKERPENGFEFKIEAVNIPPDSVLPLRLHFRDQLDEFALRHDERGLRLEAVASKYGKVKSRDPIPFKIIQVEEEGVVYRANPLGIAAFKGGKPKWAVDVQLYKEPNVIKVVGETIYIETAGGYSLYLLKDTGAFLTQHTGILGGVDPVAESVTAGREAAKLWAKDNMGRPMANYYQTGVVLKDKRVIPFLIDSIELGFGLHDKMLAIAGLEKFNGNPAPWQLSYRTGGNQLYKEIGMRRVLPDAARQAETAKWQEVFKDERGASK